MRSNYSYRVHETGVIVIIDLDQGGKSVTNDAENVLAEVRDILTPAVFDAAPAVIYRDSDGIFDGMQFSPESQAVSFYAIHSPDEKVAISLALSMQIQPHSDVIL